MDYDATSKISVIFTFQLKHLKMKTLVTLFGVLVFSISASAQDGQVYEYLTMVKQHYDLHVSIGSDGYEKFNIKSETDD